MLSPSDIRAVFGKSWVVVPNNQADGAEKHCTWGPPGSFGSLTVQIVPADMYVNGDTPVSGVGDKAHLDDVVGMWRGRAAKGKNAVNFFTSSAHLSRAKASSLLKLLVARM